MSGVVSGVVSGVNSGVVLPTRGRSPRHLRWGRTGRPARDAGQSLLEFAIALPALMAILIGIFEFGRAWNVRQVLTNSAREGARLAVIQGSSDSEVVARVEDRMDDANLDTSLATITVVGAAGGVGEPASVTVQYPFTFLFLGPIVRVMGGDCPMAGICDDSGTIIMQTTVTMRNEG
jgi:Flp pilus assembly protein TadG